MPKNVPASKVLVFSAIIALIVSVIVVLLTLNFTHSSNTSPLIYIINNSTSTTSSNQQTSLSSTGAGYPNGCIETSPSNSLNFQYEGNPCHIFLINASITPGNFSINAGVDAAVTFYNNMLLVPMSPPYMYAMMSNSSMVGMNATPPLISNLPFTVPSYTAPSNWNTSYGDMAAYNATTHDLIWETRLDAPVMSQPLVVNNTIFVSTGGDFVDTNAAKNGIYAINATTGKIIWSLTTIPEHMPTLVFYNNTLIIVPGAGTGFDSQYLMALDPKNGELLWSTFVGGESAMSSPALVGNTIYFGVRLNPQNLAINPQENALVAINLDTHQTTWESYFNGSLGTQDEPPAVWNNIVVSGYVSYPLVDNASASAGAENPTVDLKTVQDSVYLYGFNATTGKTLWVVNEGSGTNPPRSKIPAPTIYNGIVYSDGPVTGTLFAINATTGSVLWTFHTALSDPNPAVVDNHILDINQTGTLFVLDMNGTLANKVNLGLAMGWCGSGQLAIVGNELVIGGENEQVDVLPLSSLIS